jgi:transcriptional regulator with XRE-family HTH domain
MAYAVPNRYFYHFLMNPLRELRMRLNLSRPQLAKILKRSQSLLDKYESDIPEELALALAAIASEHGHRDLYFRFHEMVNGSTVQAAAPAIRPERLSPTESELVSILLDILRDPDPASHLQKSIPQMLYEIKANRDRYYIGSATS